MLFWEMYMAPSSFARFSKLEQIYSCKSLYNHDTPQKAGKVKQDPKARSLESWNSRRSLHGSDEVTLEHLHSTQHDNEFITSDSEFPILPPSPEEPPGSTQTTKRSGLREQHVATLTAVLHRCLLEGDYARASRAWGMLLRTEMHGRFLDFRRHGRWGFGAEILAFRSLGEQMQRKEIDSQHQADSDGQRSSGQQLDLTSHVQDIENAKDFYKRLIIQYPYRRVAANALSPLDFYPLLFGFWIFVINEQLAIDLKDCQSRPSQEEEAPIGSPTASVADATLKRAMKLVDDLDELLLSPPYSDYARLWNLRGMVAWWLDDLRHRAGLTGKGPSFSEAPGDTFVVKNRVPNPSMRTQKSTKAQQCFARAQALGGTHSSISRVIPDYMEV